jgi:hypothetical protein
MNLFVHLRCCTIREVYPKRLFPGLIAILALALLTPLQLEILTLQRSGQQAELSALPAWPAIKEAMALSPVLAADLNGDGQVENLILEDGEVQIEQHGQVAWRSPADWQVTQALIGDLDRDGRPEIDLLVWRPFRPWPVDRFLPYGGRIDSFQDSQGRSCQIILIAWRGNAYQERWAGSALAEPLQAFVAADLDGDGRQELVGLETSYNATANSPAEAVSVWAWNGFGFSLLARQSGAFRQMATYAPQGSEPFLVLQR